MELSGMKLPGRGESKEVQEEEAIGSGAERSAETLSGGGGRSEVREVGRRGDGRQMLTSSGKLPFC